MTGDKPQRRRPRAPRRGRPAATAADSRILAEITAGVAAGDDLDALLQRLLTPIVRLSGAQAGAVRVLSEDGQRLELVSVLGLPDNVCGHERTVDRHCGPCGTAADGAPVVWASNLDACARHSPGSFFGQGCQRLLALPLRHRGRTLGVYNLFFAGGDEPEAEVMALLRSIGELLGLALDNARLERESLRATLMQERQQMAAEVHDSLAQSIAFVKMRVPLLQDALQAHDDARAQRYCEELRGVASQAHASLRGILTQMRAPMDPLGLAHALQATTEQFRRRSSAALDYVNHLPDLRLAPDQEAQVFHIVQEALNNVARHAGARHARLHIGPAAPGNVLVEIDDDGAGLPPAGSAASSHYGLEIMGERARRLGGRLELGPRDGGGTRVRLVFPLAPAQRAAEAH
jgi:two-component system nitrate/nitrite sensor histidine kinase NarX